MSETDSDFYCSSTRPYLIRAIYEWCVDNGLTPFITVHVNSNVQVPQEFVKDDQITLNISSDATHGLSLDNDYINFKARFQGIPRDIMIPVDRVMAIYARENSQGMAFSTPDIDDDEDDESLDTPQSGSTQNATPARAPKHRSSGKAGSDQAGAARGSIHLVTIAPEGETPKPKKGEKSQSKTGASDDDPSGPTRPRPSLKRVK